MKKISLRKNSNGYILLFSIILTSILLSIAIGMITMAVRQRIFTQQVNQSTRSFYSADTALECLTALDNRGDFGTLPGVPAGAVSATCAADYQGGAVVTSTTPSPGPGGSSIYEYDPALSGSAFLEIRNSNDSEVCARARVTKFNNIGVSPTNPPLSVYEHKIEVWGYNIDCVKLQDHFYFVNNGPQSPYARFLVERSLTYTYQTEQ
jgi:hypothetical protein